METVSKSRGTETPVACLVGLILRKKHIRRLEDARMASDRLFGTATNNFSAVQYVNAIEAAIENDRSQTSQVNGWSDLVQGPDLRRLLIAVGVQCLQQAQGSSYMSNYIVSFLQAASVTNVFPVIMGINVIYYVSILTGHYLPDKFGRRPLMMSTSLFCGLTMLAVAIMNTVLVPATDASSNAAIALIFIWNIGLELSRR